jgi:hypothetical protein
MGLFDKLFGGQKKSAAVTEAPPCPHVTLVPRWDSVQDMGIEAKATRYLCDSCRQEFTPAEAEELRSGVAARLVAQEVTTEEAKAEIEASAAEETKE